MSPIVSHVADLIGKHILVDLRGPAVVAREVGDHRHQGCVNVTVRRHRVCAGITVQFPAGPVRIFSDPARPPSTMHFRIRDDNGLSSIRSASICASRPPRLLTMPGILGLTLVR